MVSEAMAAGSKRCDLCDSDRFETIARLDRRGKPLATVVCRRCGLICHGSIPTEQEIADYYASRYRKEYHREEVPSARRVMRAWNKGQRLFRDLEPTLRPGERVFEVGAGIGCNVKAFELAGYDASGVEPGIGFHHFSRQQLRARIEQTSLFQIDRPAAYDLVLLVHVIEHFCSPRRALEHICSLLKPRGRLYVECPSMCRVHAERSQLFHFAHIHNFTWPTLVMIARRAGLEVLSRDAHEDSTVLKGVFVRSDAPRDQIDQDSYSHTIDTLERFHVPSYRLDAGYLWRRLGKGRQYASELLLGRRRVRQIIQQCQHHAASTATDRRIAA